MHQSLPFEIGQEAESRSFAVGYRSAWFRCKIKNMGMHRGQYGYFLEFYDFPDEKVTWTKVHEKGPQKNQLELMVRPAFPPIIRESECPDSYPVSDVVVVVEDDWEIGDLVDWWADDCFWSGRVIKLLGSDKLQIELPEPPIGEGKTYDVYCKDLRPSLDWSPERGWTVPISREYGISQYCARLVQPCLQDEDDLQIDLKSNGMNSHEGNDPSVIPMDPSSGFQDKVLRTESKYESSKRSSDTIESAIMELEELANKIRWLKGLLQFGFQWSSKAKPSWRMLEDFGPPVKR